MKARVKVWIFFGLFSAAWLAVFTKPTEDDIVFGIKFFLIVSVIVGFGFFGNAFVREVSDPTTTGHRIINERHGSVSNFYRRIAFLVALILIPLLSLCVFGLPGMKQP